MGNLPAMAQGNPGEGATLLEIRGREGEVPHPFPVIVQELSAGVVTLQVDESMPEVNWDNLTGRQSTLRLPAVGKAPRSKMEGMLSWVKESSNGERHLILGLELADPNKSATSDLRVPSDFKMFWDSWDRIQVKPRVLNEHRIYILGLLMQLAGLLLLFLNNMPYKLTGFVIGLSGCLLISTRILIAVFGFGFKAAGRLGR
jgi:hypothetical protein